jgi:hypothetical protein
MRFVRTVVFLSFAALLAAAVPVGAQSDTLLEDELTAPSTAFDEASGGDVAAFEFGDGGMTVSTVEKGKGIYMSPGSLPESDALLNVAIEFDALLGNKKTSVGAFCRRSDANLGYTFVVSRKRYAIFGRDERDELVRLAGGKVKGMKPGDFNHVRAECERESAQGFSMVLTLELNGKQQVSHLESSAPNLGNVGLYTEGTAGSFGVATFRSLVIEELPAPS